MSQLSLIILTCTLVIVGILILMELYRRRYLNTLSYIEHQEVEKELELPPLGKEWEYDEQQVQENSDVLIYISE